MGGQGDGLCAVGGLADTITDFNEKTGRCETFSYGGCQGNDNNFKTKSACEQACPLFIEFIDDGLVPGKGPDEAAAYLYQALRAGSSTVLDLMMERPTMFKAGTRPGASGGDRSTSGSGCYPGCARYRGRRRG
mgnify:CR=1 FL=1